jgi:hypothetical protein
MEHYMKKNIAFTVLAILLAVTVFAQTAADFTYRINSTSDGVIITGYKANAAQVVIPATIENMPVTEIGERAFSKKTALTTITIPDTVTIIAYQAFWDCRLLSAVNLPEGLKKIDKYVFNTCTSLKTITIPEGVTVIADGIFYNCTALTTVKLPAGLKEIGISVFGDCKALTDITIPEGVTTIGQSCFSGSGLTSITLPASVTTISDWTFSVTNLKTIVIPEGVTEIAQGAFYGCKNLTSITLPSTLKGIGGSSFQNCSTLTTVTIPPTLKTVAFYAVYDAESYFKRPDDKKDTANRAFEGTKLNLASQTAVQKLGYTGSF